MPVAEIDDRALLGELAERLQNVEDLVERTRHLHMAATVSPIGGAEGLEAVVRDTILRTPPDRVAYLAPVAARFPSLRSLLLERSPTDGDRDLVRYHITRVVDFPDAIALARQIETSKWRGQALTQLAYRAPTLETKLAALRDLLAVALPPDAWTYSSVYALRTHAAEAPKEIGEFLEEKLPADDAMPLYVAMAGEAHKTSADAATSYMEAAWSRLPQTRAPHEHAALLLRRDPRGVDRATWVARFDQHVLPVLARGETGIGPLSELARFDIELMIDRTRRSAQSRGRSFAGLLPKVMADALRVSPLAVLQWLEQSDSELRSACLLEIAEHTAAEDGWKLPESQPRLERLAKLMLQMDDPDSQLQAIADFVSGLTWLGVEPPKAVAERGRVLLGRRYEFTSLDLNDRRHQQLFWLGTPDQQRRLLAGRIDSLRSVAEYQQQMAFVRLCDLISRSQLADAQRLELLQRLASAAHGEARRYLISSAASHAAPLDPDWALRTIWSVLPEDRGRSGKARYIDWIPPPYDAADATEWLWRTQPSAEAEGRLISALWRFLSRAPETDRDGIRLRLVGKLLQAKLPRHAAGVAAEIADSSLAIEVRILLLSRQRDEA